MPKKSAKVVSIGHNSGTIDKVIKTFVERFENLEKEKNDLKDDFKELSKQAKDAGLNVKAIRQIVREREMDMEKREALEELNMTLNEYRAALGMLSGTELGNAALKRKAEEAAADDKETVDA